MRMGRRDECFIIGKEVMVGISGLLVCEGGRMVGWREFVRKEAINFIGQFK